jgi:hypothetical protein
MIMKGVTLAELLKSLVNIAVLWADIRTMNLPNTIQDYWQLYRDFL